MCTAVSIRSDDHYFGRTLDHDASYGEEIILTPRRHPLPFRWAGTLDRHYGILGTALAAEGYPLYYDAFNEKGLAMAGLNFVGYARYGEPVKEEKCVAQFELLPWVLAQCATVREAEQLLSQTLVVNAGFSEELPPARLHWMLADGVETSVLEVTEEGLRLYDNPAEVLTNNPPFPMQMFRLNDFMDLHTGGAELRFGKQLPLWNYSRGLGAMGLPGDLSSQSRFVRAAFWRQQIRLEGTEEQRVAQFLRLMGTVEMPLGCCITEDGKPEYTVYASCCNISQGIYYYRTHGSTQICGIRMKQAELESCGLIRHPMVRQSQIAMGN